MPASTAKPRRVKVVQPEAEETAEPVEEFEPDENPTEVEEPAENVTEDTDRVAEDEPEELADDDELWDGGPTYGDLKAWHAEYGENNVFCSLINPDFDEYCVWRTLNRHEYRELMKQLEAAVNSGQVSETEATFDNEEKLTEICVLYPPYNRHDKAHTNAGFPRLMANDIMEQSGFVPVEVRKI